MREINERDEAAGEAAFFVCFNFFGFMNCLRLQPEEEQCLDRLEPKNQNCIIPQSFS